MKVIRDGVFVKIVPKKFEHVLDGFEFKTEKKRLRADERYGLLQRLIQQRFSGDFRCAQARFAQNCIEMHVGDIEIIKVNKRTHFQWRVKANGTEINVEPELVEDCPKIYLIEKNEF